jgi:hypothetical protein
VQEVRTSIGLAALLWRVLRELGEGWAAGAVAVQGPGCWTASVGRGNRFHVSIFLCQFATSDIMLLCLKSIV